LNSNLHTKIEELIKPVVTAMGYELWGLEIHKQGAHSLVRVYIDKEDGVNLDDCSRVSYQISGLLDVEDPITHKYVLEVSSPGLDRPLFNQEQFRRYVGTKVRIKLYAPNVRRNYLGIITEVNTENVVIKNEEEQFILPFKNIEKANLLPNYEVGP
jgi:ribosome maturation factor RimP